MTLYSDSTLWLMYINKFTILQICSKFSTNVIQIDIVHLFVWLSYLLWICIVSNVLKFNITAGFVKRTSSSKFIAALDVIHKVHVTFLFFAVQMISPSVNLFLHPPL